MLDAINTGKKLIKGVLNMLMTKIMKSIMLICMLMLSVSALALEPVKNSAKKGQNDE